MYLVHRDPSQIKHDRMMVYTSQGGSQVSWLLTIAYFHIFQCNLIVGVPLQLSGFVCAFHPATPGSSPKHTIYAFSIYIVQIVYLSLELECEKNENKTKRGRDWPIFYKKNVLNFRRSTTTDFKWLWSRALFHLMQVEKNH